MGKFDLDDILNPDSHRNPDDDASPETPDVADESDDTAASDDTSADDANQKSTAPAVDETPGDDETTMFRRTDPREIPRPPDLTGSGLGTELDRPDPARDADPLRARPDDGLVHLFNPDKNIGDAMQTLMDMLHDREQITGEQKSSVERLEKSHPHRSLQDLLLEVGLQEEIVQRAVAELNDMAFERIDVTTDEDIESLYEEKAMFRLTPEFCKENGIIPLRREGSRLVVGTTRPNTVFLLDEVKRRLNVPFILPVLILQHDVNGLFEMLTAAEQDEQFNVDDLLSDVEEDDVEVVHEEEQEDGSDDADSSPVVRYVNHIIQTAIKEGASDIHIEPDEKSLQVRFRIDGVLFEMMSPPKKMHAALSSRIKIMANLDIAERRLPQDGRIRATVLGRKLDLRVSTIPTSHGEKTVMRILDNRSIQVGLEELGFHEDTLTIWQNQIKQPHGIIMVTGPTGSGKTTTLYSSIRQMDLKKLNVSTVEDPVEYNLSNITQIQTHELIGMTFAKALKALLRQDPDVVMVGEIRDLETATTAIQASMTGHLVLSTLHTNDAPSSLTRLINIGVEPFLIGAACNAVLAQRLVRRICPKCKGPMDVSEDMQEFLVMHGLAGTELMQAEGCGHCRQTGYQGRVGLYELLLLDDYLRDAVSRNPSVTEFRRMCKERGMVTLREDGFAKVGEGRTTIEEVLRVTEATI